MMPPTATSAGVLGCLEVAQQGADRQRWVLVQEAHLPVLAVGTAVEGTAWEALGELVVVTWAPRALVERGLGRVEVVVALQERLPGTRTWSSATPSPGPCPPLPHECACRQ